MIKTFTKKLLPVLLVLLLTIGIFPVQAAAAPKHYSNAEISTSDGPPSDDSGSDTETVPNEETPSDSSGSSSSSSSGDSESENPDSQPESDAASSESEAATDWPNGATVYFGNPNARGATGTLTLTKHPGYQYDMNKGMGGSVNLQPWYTATIDGRLAYCVEPENHT